MKKIFIQLILFYCFFACGDHDGAVPVEEAPEVAYISIPSAMKLSPLTNTQLLITYEDINGEIIENPEASEMVYVVSDTNLFTVSDGKVQTKAQNGTGVLSIYMKEKTMIKTMCNVTVSSFSLSINENMSLKVGDSLQLSASLRPIPSKAVNVMWESSNKQVLEVKEDGSIRALATGKATITAYLKEVPGVKDTCSVLVSVGSLDDIKWNSERVYLQAGTSFNVYDKLGIDESNRVLFSLRSASLGIVTVAQNGVATAIKEGKSYIYLCDGLGSPLDTMPITVYDEINIPDEKFKARLVKLYDANGDSKITYNEINNVTSLSLASLGITSLEGIEYFTSLTALNCNYDPLTSVDLSKNTGLKTIYFVGCGLTSLDLTNCPSLSTVDIRDNDLTEMDFSKNTLMVYLYCDNNKLTSLNTEKNIKLYKLTCNSNRISDFNIAYNSIRYLDCGNNKIKELPINKYYMTTLICEYNQLDELDISKLTNLVTLSCAGNRISSLPLTKLTKLTTISCEQNSLTELDMTNQTVLAELVCNGNSLNSINLTTNTELKKLYCYENNLKSLSLAACVNLKYLLCNTNNLTTLDVTGCTQLSYLATQSNRLSVLDLTNNSELSYVNCLDNPLEVIYIANSSMDTERWIYPEGVMMTTND